MLAGFEPLAPSHQPHNLAPIRELLRARPDLPQVACFDTAFHRTAPLVAELYGLPRDLFDAGVRRYGFHGLSYEYIVQALGKLDPAAIEQVRDEAWPDIRDSDELHDALQTLIALPEDFRNGFFGSLDYALVGKKL